MIIWVYACMPKRTTIILDDEVYELLVMESVKKYGSTKAISKVVNDIVRERLRARRELLELIFSEKKAEASEEEFEEFRRELSRRFEER